MLNSDYIYYLWNAIKWRFQKYDVLIPEHIFDTQSSYRWRDKKETVEISVWFICTKCLLIVLYVKVELRTVQLFKSMFKKMSVLVDAFSGAKRLWSNKSNIKK